MNYRYFDDLVDRYPVLGDIKVSLIVAYKMLLNCYDRQGMIFIAGNGGSRADADHIAGELIKGFIKKRPIPQDIQDRFSGIPGGEEISSLLQEGISAIPLGNTALSSAISNDTDANMDYAQQLYVLGKSDDVLLAISTSGNAENVCNAAVVAKACGLSVISLTGETGGKLRSLSDIYIAVPEVETYKIQELHLPIYHALCAQLEDELFD